MVIDNRSSLVKSQCEQESLSATQTSLTLIQRAVEEDGDAWNRLVKIYSPLVYYWCQSSGLPQVDLNDVFQDVFHTLARNITKYRPVENGSFRGWLRTLSRNKLMDYFRKNRNEPKPVGGTEGLNFLVQVPGSSDPFSGVLSEDVTEEESEIQKLVLRNALEAVRGHFSESTWKAFWMVVIGGRSAADVAEELSMRPGTVRVAKSRVLSRLRSELGELPAESL